MLGSIPKINIKILILLPKVIGSYSDFLVSYLSRGQNGNTSGRITTSHLQTQELRQFAQLIIEKLGGAQGETQKGHKNNTGSSHHEYQMATTNC